MRRLIAWLVVASALFGVLVLVGLFAGGSSKPNAGCIPSSQIVNQLRAAKPGGENFKPPYDKKEVAKIKAQEIAWVRKHLDDSCVKAMAAHVNVKPSALPSWLQKANLKKVGKTGLAWFKNGKEVFTLNGSVYSPPKKTTTAAKCASTVHYYVLSDHDFGPALKGSTPKARLHDLQTRYCVDPLLTADNARAMKLTGFTNLTDSQVRVAAQQLVAHRADWRKLVKALDAKEDKDLRSDVVLTGEYRTGYMVPQHNGMPLLRSTQLSSTERSLRFKVGSSTVYIQEPCGGQPRVQVHAETVAARPSPSSTPPVVTVVVRHQPPPTCKTGKLVNGKCVIPPPPGCKVTHTCSPPPPPTCKTGKLVNGKCVIPPPPGCKVTHTCSPPPPPTCKTGKLVNGKCVIPPPPGCKVTHTCSPPPPCSTCTSKVPPPVQDSSSPSQANDGPTPGASSQPVQEPPTSVNNRGDGSGSGSTVSAAPAPTPTGTNTGSTSTTGMSAGSQTTSSGTTVNTAPPSGNGSVTDVGGGNNGTNGVTSTGGGTVTSPPG